MQAARLAFLHGFMGHPSDWDEVRVAVESHESHDSHESLAVEIQPSDDWVSCLRELSELISPQAILVGYSMGARLALGLAIEFPTRYRGLVFISGNPGLESQEARDQRWLSDQRIASHLESQSLQDFLTGWYRQSVFEHIPQEILDSVIERKRKQDPRDWPATLRSLSVSKQPDYWKRIHDLKIPMLAIAGERDQKYSEIVTRLERESCLVESQVFASCGHLVHHEFPGRLAEEIAQFVDRVQE